MTSEDKSKQFPESYNPKEREVHWQETWSQNKTYEWTEPTRRDESYIIDTPPPTASGSLHVGHIFSYTQTDIVARYKRMRGKQVFYPIGWDDNGLPTERRVQNFFRIGCNPALPYDAALQFDPTSTKYDGPLKPVSRRNFIEACELLTKEDEKSYKQLFRRQGISFDWRYEYATIDSHCRRISQRSFLDLFEKKYAYQQYAPTMWDVEFRSAVAQAEIEDREIEGLFHQIRFEVDGGADFVIATTRPELLPACVAVVAHPEDERFIPLFGKTARTPLFSAGVPIIPSTVAEKEKGTGIMMICTFGDLTDVQIWSEHKLPLRQVIGYDGRMKEISFAASGDFQSSAPDTANKFYQTLKGLRVDEARKSIIALLAENSSKDGKPYIVGEPKVTKHPVKFYEKGSKPLEIIPSRQWFVRLLAHKEQLIAQGRKVTWHPDHMRTRYEHWVSGLNQDWCISRQRYFGVPFPVWYPIHKDGEVDWDHPIFADRSRLPVDPVGDVPPGYSEEQRDKPGGFKADPDVMDTWATSSLTPQIQSYWELDQKRHATLFPMDLRPQAHEIIRTWAFYTIVKAWMHEGEIPWKHAAISGFIMDSDRKKMSKSKGNVIVPLALIEEHSADAIRYWAARGRLGIDTVFDTTVFKIGNKLVLKLFNATRFLVKHLETLSKTPRDFSLSMVRTPLDRAFLNEMKSVVTDCTRLFEDYEHSLALQKAEQTFWGFCDHYLEMVKTRFYATDPAQIADRDSAIATTSWALGTFLRLFAPVLPHVTEELWSCTYAAGSGKSDSIHLTRWPSADELAGIPSAPDENSYQLAVEILSAIRREKAKNQRGAKWPVAHLRISHPATLRPRIEEILPDVLRAGSVVDQRADISVAENLSGYQVTVEVRLGESDRAENS